MFHFTYFLAYQIHMDGALLVVLGGTGFMGRHVLQEAKGLIHTVTINRGRTYWEGDLIATPPMSKVTGDRGDERSMTKAIAEVCRIHSGLCVGGVIPTVTVVDFSCDDKDEMRAVFVALRELMPSQQGKVFVRSIHRYVLVSSDSVYAPTYISSGVTEDATLCSPASKGYSGEKLRGEMQLGRDVTAAIRDGLLGPSFQAIVFRLPDVLGPYDRSGRFWATVLWATSKVPMLLSPSCTPVRGQLLSFVSGVDVAKKVVQIATGVVPPTGRAIAAYNLACPEQTTLVNFVRLVASEVHAQTGLDVAVRESAPSSYDDSDSSSSDIIDSSDDEVDACSCDYYPSVRCGPLDLSLSTAELQWAPTSLAMVVRGAVAFFLAAGSVDPARGIHGPFPAECRAAIKRLPTLVKLSLVSK